jgi:hypothetical protein
LSIAEFPSIRLCHDFTSTNTGRVMATEVYLQIDGIKGESADSGHKDWI